MPNVSFLKVSSRISMVMNSRVSIIIYSSMCSFLPPSSIVTTRLKSISISERSPVCFGSIRMMLLIDTS